MIRQGEWTREDRVLMVIAIILGVIWMAYGIGEVLLWH